MLKSRATPTDLIVLSTAIGLVATFSAPWMELRGSYSAWRISEWHTFWRGASAFLLSDVVAASYRIPIEFAITAMENAVSRLFVLGVVLAVWHSAVFFALVFAGARWRWRRQSSSWRVAAQLAILLAGSLLVLFLFASILALPSSLSPKVDFRTQSDIHADSLIWSSLSIFPVAPLLSVAALLVQIAALAWKLRSRSVSPYP